MMLIVGLELGEVQVVVENLAGIVEDGTLGFGDNLLQWHGLELRSGYEFIEVIDIGLQVLTIVILNRFPTDDGFQRIGRVWKRYEAYDC